MTSTGRSDPHRISKSAFWASVSTTIRSAARIVASDSDANRLVSGPFAISRGVGSLVAAAARWARWITYTFAARGWDIDARIGYTPGESANTTAPCAGIMRSSHAATRAVRGVDRTRAITFAGRLNRTREK